MGRIFNALACALATTAVADAHRTGLRGRSGASTTALTAPASLVAAAPAPPYQPPTHRPVKTYTIDLDLAPEKRYAPLFADPSNGFNDTVWKFYNDYFANDAPLRDVLYGITLARGDEDAEMMGEIHGMSDTSKLPLRFVHSMQLLYEIQTLMLPIENYTSSEPSMHHRLPEGYEALAHLPWRGPGCTGIIAKCADGAVWHARNLDFVPLDIMTDLVYNGVFTRNGTEVFRSQMAAGYAQVITAAVMGPDGYVLERNTRYPDHEGGNKQMLANLVGGRALNGWTLRKIMEKETTFDGAIEAFSTAKYLSTEYAIVSGVGKGKILSRDPDKVAHIQELGKPTHGERNDWIIMTNFDFFFDDAREWFDPTGGGGLGKPTRREAAMRLLNGTAEGQLTPDDLFATINAQYVLADTIFQGLMSVEKGVWNVSQPNIS